MKTPCALAFIALVATAIAAPGSVWVGEWESSPGDPPIEAVVINSNDVKIFKKKESNPGVVILQNQDLSLRQPNPDLRNEIGVQLIGRETFYGLDLIGFKKESEEVVLMVMRFLGLNGSNKQYRLEIPLLQLPEESEIEAQEEQNHFTFFDENWHERIGIESPVDEIIPFYFGWFEFLLQFNVRYLTEPSILEGGEHEADTYESLPVLLPADVMNNLLSAL